MKSVRVIGWLILAFGLVVLGFYLNRAFPGRGGFLAFWGLAVAAVGLARGIAKIKRR
ncbi:hypothetical protein QYE77_14850 (plasmid) [Thermanaerothrix sp. 4228-RoL]|uniref:Uncharacterized protein n=1 Tax=Thermanaerothrix solaris TaxID=3058434 RepID=A0ABU3NUM8_9CHLR|nr:MULTISPECIES: hypothetical protein [unclassified Thermanaerothrix]MDT8899541.1 hypothetical protein [Thermanaerothrix sp. 4228-RoL]